MRSCHPQLTIFWETICHILNVNVILIANCPIKGWHKYHSDMTVLIVMLLKVLTRLFSRRIDVNISQYKNITSAGIWTNHSLKHKLWSLYSKAILCFLLLNLSHGWHFLTKYGLLLSLQQISELIHTICQTNIITQICDFCKLYFKY